MSALNNSLLLGAPAGAGGYSISRSLRFSSADSSFLSRTPASAGNRKTWTWAGWVKRSGLGYGTLFSAGLGGDECAIYFDASNTIFLDLGFTTFRATTAVFRDIAGWMHIVVGLDTTSSTAQNRLRLYINGSEVTAWNTNQTIAQNAEFAINTAIQHEIGRLAYNSGIYLSAYLADLFFIDGQQLTPSAFGEFSATTGVWVPKAYSGTYGTNGFHLDFADNSSNTATTLGKDTSGNGNHWLLNNIQAQAQSSTGNSVYFDGSGDRITATNANLALGSGNFTVECYFKPATGYSTQSALLSYTANSPEFEFDGNQIRWMTSATYGSTLSANTWYHVAWTREGSTGRIFLDGALVGTVTDTTNFTATSIAIGARVDGSTQFKGWISNLRVVVGTALYTSAFSRPVVPLTAVTGTKLLTCQSGTIVDNSTVGVSLTTVGDTAVSNDIPSVSIAGSQVDSLVDVPTNGSEVDTGLGGQVRGNYAVLNPLALTGSVKTYSNGNLEVTITSNNNLPSVVSTVGASSGKWYAEVLAGWSASGIGFINAASVTDSIEGSYGLGTPSDGWLRYGTNIFNNNGTHTSGLTSVATNDIVQLALDLDNGKAWFGRNGTWENSGNPATGANPSVTFTPGGKTFLIGSTLRRDNVAVTMIHNFGQRSWAYQAPTNFKALNTASLPASVVTKPSTAFDVKLYTGNGSTQTISGLGFSPDLVWIKRRSVNSDHNLFDAVRGATQTIKSNNTDAEVTASTSLTAFNSDGFSVGSNSDVNGNTHPVVAWAWDAGNTTVTNTQGSITSQVRANASAGFSVVTYTGTGSNATVGHGLGVKPAFYIVKGRSNSDNWCVYHTSLTANNLIFLNLTNASGASARWNNTEPTSTVFSLGTDSSVNGNGTTYVCYAFSPVVGYSSMGSYVGNGSASDGPFVFCGFRPSVVILKRSNGAADWIIQDSKRPGYNTNTLYLKPNGSSEEIDSTGETNKNYIDFLSNGFKLRGSDLNTNAAQTYIYCAWAESPFAANNRAR